MGSKNRVDVVVDPVELMEDRESADAVRKGTEGIGEAVGIAGGRPSCRRDRRSSIYVGEIRKVLYREKKV